MSSVHEQNLYNAERALENLRANMASGMAPDEVLVKLSVDCEAVDFDAFASYFSEPAGTHPDVERPKYASLAVKVAAAKGRTRDYFDGKVSAAEALASISERLGMPSDQRTGSAPAPGVDEGEAPPGPPPSSKGAAPPADELIRKQRQQFQETMNVANSLLTIGKVEDPKGVEALENARDACRRMIALLDEQAAISEGLDGEEAKLELALMSDKVIMEFEYVGVMLKVAMRHMPKEDGGGKRLNRTDHRDPGGKPRAPSGQASQPPRPQPLRPPRRTPPPPPPFGLSWRTWNTLDDLKPACGCILLFAVAGVLFWFFFIIAVGMS